jgi:hypothetical protein
MKLNSFLAFLFTLIAVLIIIYGLFMEYSNLFIPKNDCEGYSLFLFPDVDKLDTQIGKGIIVKLRVINAGSFGDRYEVSLTGPEWVIIRPTSFSLKAEESKTLFLYISPSLGNEGKYDIGINVKSKCITESQTIEVNVLNQ